MQSLEIQKWGNSAAVRLNKGILQQVSCEIGSKVEAVVMDGGVFLKPVKAPTYTLDELLDACTKKNTRLDDEDKAWLNSAPLVRKSNAKTKYYPQRGDIIFTDFDPAAGKEQNLNRPALVLSPKPFNQKIELALVAPISSKVRGHGFEVVLQNTRTKGVVLCHQVKVIDYNERGCKFIEKSPESIVLDVLAKVRLLVT